MARPSTHVRMWMHAWMHVQGARILESAACTDGECSMELELHLAELLSARSTVVLRLSWTVQPSATVCSIEPSIESSSNLRIDPSIESSLDHRPFHRIFCRIFHKTSHRTFHRMFHQMLHRTLSAASEGVGKFNLKNRIQPLGFSSPKSTIWGSRKVVAEF